MFPRPTRQHTTLPTFPVILPNAAESFLFLYTSATCHVIKFLTLFRSGSGFARVADFAPNICRGIFEKEARNGYRMVSHVFLFQSRIFNNNIKGRRGRNRNVTDMVFVLAVFWSETMRVHWRVLSLYSKIPKEQRAFSEPCARCFSELVLHHSTHSCCR